MVCVKSVRNDVHAEARAVNGVNGKRDAIERDRALFGDEAARARAGSRSKNLALSPSGSRAMIFARPSIWPVTRWPPSSSPKASGRSRLMRRPFLPGAERGARQRLVRGFDGEDGALVLRLAHLDDGQAAAVAGDRGALLEASALVTGRR